MRPGEEIELDNPEVLVVGAGVIGACCAYEISKTGVKVGVVEGRAGPAQGCSLGSAGLLAPTHVSPLVSPGNILQGAWSLVLGKGIFRPNIGPTGWPDLATLGGGILWNGCSRQDVGAHLTAQAAESYLWHRSYEREGLHRSLRANGLVSTLGKTQKVERKSRTWEAGIAGGILPREVIDRGYVVSSNAAHCDSLRLTRDVMEAAAARGCTVRYGIRVTSIIGAEDARKASDVYLSDGERLRPSIIVLAAGIETRELCWSLGIRLRMFAGKGYHIDVIRPKNWPEVPIYCSDERMVLTPFEGRVRISAGIDIGDLTQQATLGRIRGILRTAEAFLGKSLVVDNIWSGIRPCSWNGQEHVRIGLPYRNVIVATGHGMQGVLLGPLTGKKVAELVLEVIGEVSRR